MKPTGEPDWNQAPPFGRRETLLRTLQRLWALHPGPAMIVETGTLRDASEAGCGGDGWSAVAWGWYAAQTGGQAVTVDISPEAIAVCRKHTAAYADHLAYVLSDSVAFLRQWRQQERGAIHLLYLDSLDYHDVPASEAHCLAEAQAALPALAPTALVLLDDTHPQDEAKTSFWGKGAQAVPFLVEQGFGIGMSEGGQVLLLRERPEGPAGGEGAAGF